MTLSDHSYHQPSPSWLDALECQLERAALADPQVQPVVAQVVAFFSTHHAVLEAWGREGFVKVLEQYVHTDSNAAVSALVLHVCSIRSAKSPEVAEIISLRLAAFFELTGLVGRLGVRLLLGALRSTGAPA